MIFSECSKICWRRACGVVGFFSCIVAMFSDIDHSALQTIATLSAMLLGSTAVDLFKPKNGE